MGSMAAITCQGTTGNNPITFQCSAHRVTEPLLRRHDTAASFALQQHTCRSEWMLLSKENVGVPEKTSSASVDLEIQKDRGGNRYG
jgi:hypothetical protein